MLQLSTKFAPRSEQEFKLAYDAGFRNAEFWLSTELLENWKSIALRAGDFAMGYALHFPNRGKFNERHLQNVIDLYYALDCSALVIHQPMFDEFGDELLAIDDTIRLAIENHNLRSDYKFERWVEESRWLTLDVEHLWIYTAKDGSMKKMLKYVDWLLTDHADKLAHVHLPGYQPGYKTHRPMYCSRKMVFQVFSKLAEVSFDGLIVSETLNKYQNPEELRMDVLLYRHWLKKFQARRVNEDVEKRELQSIGKQS